MNLREFWEEREGGYRERVYLYFQGQEITYGKLDRKANRVTNGFLESGIRKGDKVSFLLPNCPEFLYLWFGLNKMGGRGSHQSGDHSVKRM